MLNAIRMDLYRMFRTKSLYVIWGVMIFVILFTTYLAKLETESDELAQMQELSQEMNDESNINFGMSVNVPTSSGDKITLLDITYGNIQGKALAIFLVIFAVLFSTADTTSGFIKTIGGHIPKKSYLVISKSVSLLVHTVLTFGIFIVMQSIANRIFLGYLKIGDIGTLATYILVQILLNFALAIVCMAIAIVIRSNVFSMIAAICICMNVMTFLYNGVDMILDKAGIEDFHTFKYVITGKISLLPMELSKSDISGALAVAVIFLAASLLIECIVVEKRDIV